MSYLVFVVIILDSDNVLYVFIWNEGSDPNKMDLRWNNSRLFLRPNYRLFVELVNTKM